MKFYKYLFLFSIILSSILGCKPSPNTNLVDEIQLSPYKIVKADEICEISVPKYFYEIDDINPKALIQQGYIEDIDSVKIAKNYIGDEIYVIVLVDYKFEMEQIYGDTIEIGIEIFNKMCQENLEMILDDFSAEFENPKVQVENGVKSIHNEFLGRIDEYLVYYQIGVFETETGYYQVLTWTMQEYMNKHKEEMLVMTTSFQEL
jgi:hypothetical protein